MSPTSLSTFCDSALRIKCSKIQWRILDVHSNCTVKKRLRQLMLEFKSIKQELQCQLPLIDFMHVSLLFLVSNDKGIHKNSKIHGRKL